MGFMRLAVLLLMRKVMISSLNNCYSEFFLVIFHTSKQISWLYLKWGNKYDHAVLYKVVQKSFDTTSTILTFIDGLKCSKRIYSILTYGLSLLSLKHYMTTTIPSNYRKHGLCVVKYGVSGDLCDTLCSFRFIIYCTFESSKLYNGSSRQSR